MLVRSPRRFAIWSFIAFIFIFAVLQESPWAHRNVYEQLPPLFKASSKLNLSEVIGLESDRIQAHLEDAWQYAIPAATPAAGVKEEEAKTPVATPEVINAGLVASGADADAPVVSIEESKPTATKISDAQPPWVTDASRTEPIAPTFSRPANMKEYIKKMLNWGRPTWDGHWPPFRDYINMAYDPNRWEQFPM